MNCPHCMSPLNEGATVCSHCGAYEEKRLGFLATLLRWLGPLWMVGVLILLPFGRAAEGLALLIGYPVLYAAVARMFPGRKVWVHRRR